MSRAQQLRSCPRCVAVLAVLTAAWVWLAARATRWLVGRPADRER